MAPKPKPKKAAAAKKAPAKKPASKEPKDESKAKVTVTASQPIDASGCVPIDPATGLPLIEITVSASEKVPTGDYANVDVGPVTMKKWIRDPQDDDALVEQINDMCELIEVGVVAEQRELVLQSLQNAAA